MQDRRENALVELLIYIAGVISGALVVGFISGATLNEKEYKAYRKGFEDGKKVGGANDI